VRQLRDRRRPTAGAPGLRRPLRKASVPSFAGGDRPSTGLDLLLTSGVEAKRRT